MLCNTWYAWCQNTTILLCFLHRCWYIFNLFLHFSTSPNVQSFLERCKPRVPLYFTLLSEAFWFPSYKNNTESGTVNDMVMTYNINWMEHWLWPWEKDWSTALRVCNLKLCDEIISTHSHRHRLDSSEEQPWTWICVLSSTNIKSYKQVLLTYTLLNI